MQVELVYNTALRYYVFMSMKPLGKTSTGWSEDLAYAIGLIVSDGNLSNDGRHIIFTSKDYDLAVTFKEVLGLDVTIGKKSSGTSEEKKYYVVQFGDKIFYNFLISLGITPKKSKTIGKVAIPKKYFYHYLRGNFDGDGSFYSYWDKRWKSSFMYYFVIASASQAYISWLRDELRVLVGINGHVTKELNGSTYQLRYAKAESLKIIHKIYPSKQVRCLARKRLKIELALSIIGERLV